MKIQLKINLAGLGILLAVAMAVAMAGVLTIEMLSQDLNRKLLSTELDSIVTAMADAHKILVESGVDNAPGYIESAQQEVLRKLAAAQSVRFGHLAIVAASDILIFHEKLKPGDRYDLSCLARMLEQDAGVAEGVWRGENLLNYHRTFSPWGWKVILSASTQEMMAMRTEFLRKALIIMAVSLVLGGAILILLTRGIVRPVQELAKAAKELSQGRFDTPLPKVRPDDEVAELTRAFRVMSVNLASLHQDLERRTVELTEANKHLNLEVAERRKAENQLADLNRDLERQVELRTGDLALKAEELEQANKRLREMDELKSSFLSSVSHELRTPLTSVLGFAKVISKDFTRHYRGFEKSDRSLAKRGDRILQNLEIIDHEGRRLTRMINDLLDLAKIESGRIDWCDRKVNIQELIGRVVDSVRPGLEAKPGIKLYASVEPEAMMIFADPYRMEQVLINIVNNAIKFTSEGKVDIRIRRLDKVVRIEIEDTGEGVPTGDLEKIFDKFHQVISPDTRKEKQQGTGLGLAICRQIVQHYNGRIWAESKLGQGSVFKVDLPMSAEIEPLKEPPPDPDPEVLSSSGAPVILVVDDDPGIRQYFMQVLEGEGYAVVNAPDGATAIEKARRYKPDLITMDILMPGCDGREIIKTLRRTPELAATPILAISVLKNERFSEEDAALHKPVGEEELLEAVRSLIGRGANCPVMVLKESGRRNCSSFFAFASENIEQADEEEFWRRIKSGFKGVVIFSQLAAESMDSKALASLEGVRVIILPNG